MNMRTNFTQPFLVITLLLALGCGVGRGDQTNCPLSYQALHSFGNTNQVGMYPGELIEGSDGRLYGTTTQGGYAGYGVGSTGVVYVINHDGTGYQVLHNFIGGTNDGSWPTTLLEGSDGLLYGTTRQGTVFKLNKSGSGYETLHTLGLPLRGLIETTNGVLYGWAGDIQDTNVIFRINRDGTDFAMVREFSTWGEGIVEALIQASDGLLYGAIADYFDVEGVFRINLDGTGFTVLHSEPSWSVYSGMQLIEGTDGVLYGASAEGGSSFQGAIFKLNRDGSGYTQLVDFTNSTLGQIPSALMEGVDGKLYGTTFSGGTNGNGVVLAMAKNGSDYTVLRSLNSPGPESPVALIQGMDGGLYCVTASGGAPDLGALFTIATNGNNYELLWSFSNFGGSEGFLSGPPIIQGSDGKLYGLTYSGGAFAYWGTMYRMNADGTAYELLRSFTPESGTSARAGLLEASDSVLYGTSSHGGLWGEGSVFTVNHNGTGYTELLSFDQNVHGRTPAGTLIEGTNGALYGLAEFGGANNRGTVFRINRDGTGFAKLHDFTSAEHPSEVNSLLLGSDGAIYGTAGDSMFATNGIVFRINHDGSGYAVLRTFGTPREDGLRPVGALIEISNKLYGVTSIGGSNNLGTVFRMNLDGSGHEVLRHLGETAADARSPEAGLVLGPCGLLYGTANGGAHGHGVVFCLKPDGSDYSVLHNFNAATADGRAPRASLFVGSNDTLFGTTHHDGVMDGGIVFKLASAITSNAPPQLVNTIPDQTNVYGAAMLYTFPTNSFSDPDAGQMLGYTTSNLPPGIAFDGPMRTFSGTPTNVGVYAVTVTATDDGAPPLSTNISFSFTIAPAPLVVTANDTSRHVGQANPSFTGMLVGVTNGDNISVTFDCAATESSPAGDYPIHPMFHDPDDRLGNYSVTTNVGMLHVLCPTNLVVTSPNDSGPGSLREAITLANLSCAPGAVLISFNIPGTGVHTIAPLTALPIITRPMSIDGYTQPGSTPNTLANADNALLRIELSGANVSSDHGLRFQANDCTVRGLVINGFAVQLLFESATNGVVEGNFLGTDATGVNTNGVSSVNGVQIIGGANHRVGGLTPAARNIMSGNWYVGINAGQCAGLQVVGNFIGIGADGLTTMGSSWGIYLSGCTQTQIGGAAAGARNVIAGHSTGCWIADGGNNVVQGNFIGTDAAGTLRRTNVNGLVLQQSPNNLVGGAGPGEGNLFSGNGTGIYLEGAGASNNIMAGNLIGPDLTGTNALGQDFYGLNVVNAPNNTIGGLTPGARNVICGSGFAGIAVSSPTATNNLIQGNFIGLDITGTNALPRDAWGIYVESASGNQIGGTDSGARNVIARSLHGVGIISGSNNVVQGNFIGTDATGTRGLGNTQRGIIVGTSAPGTLIGGSLPGAGNVIAANGYDGILIDAPATTVQGNIIGADATGTNALFNNWSGIGLGAAAQFTQVGGTNPAARNVISGNGGIGMFSSSNVVQGNYFGVGADGSTIVGTPGFAIYISSSSHGNQIGGDGAGAGNVLGGWFAPIRISGSNNVVQGNLIGTDATGTQARTVQNYGLTIWGQNNLIGGVTSGARNVIAASSSGIVVSGIAATGNTIQGNFIGTDITGMNPLPNGWHGVFIEAAAGNTIGGTTPEARNVISGNEAYGIGVGDDGASNNIIQGNYIGLAADGIAPLPNYAGVRIGSGASGNLIGGVVPGAGNWLAYNSHYGISAIGDATNNAFLGNTIYSNGWYGIDLGEDGVTSNDPGDADGSPNHFQNFPEIASAKLVAGDLTVNYRVDSAPANSAYPLTVEFFRADSAISSQGRTLIYRHIYDTPQTFTNLTFTPLVAVNTDDPIVATATDANGNTSEFSPAVQVTVLPTPPLIEFPTILAGGEFQFGFTNVAGATFTALASTNVALPFGGWTVLGPVTEIAPGQFQFTDPQATNSGQRFYRVRSP